MNAPWQTGLHQAGFAPADGTLAAQLPGDYGTSRWQLSREAKQFYPEGGSDDRGSDDGYGPGVTASPQTFFD